MYGIPIEQVKQMTKQIEKQAAEAGLTYCFDTMQHTNTFTAHRLVKYAERHEKGNDNLLPKVEEICRNLTVPVGAKEVGFGIDGHQKTPAQVVLRWHLQASHSSTTSENGDAVCKTNTLCS